MNGFVNAEQRQVTVLMVWRMEMGVLPGNREKWAVFQQPV
jgi:hypothetical protein